MAAGAPGGCSARLGHRDEPGCARPRALSVSRVWVPPNSCSSCARGTLLEGPEPLPALTRRARLGYALHKHSQGTKNLTLKKKKERLSGLEVSSLGSAAGRGDGPAPLLCPTGCPSSPISSALAPGEALGWRGLSKGSCLPTPPGTAPSPPASPSGPAPGTSPRTPAGPRPRSSC